MKKLIITTVFICFSLITFAQVQGFLDYETNFTNNKRSQMIYSWFYDQDSSGFGLWNFSLVSPSWGETQIGVLFGKSIKQNFYLEGGIGAGFETDSSPFRFSGYTFGKSKNFWFLGFAEYGGSGDWYTVITEKQFGNFGIGLQAQKFSAHGLRTSYKLNHALFYSILGYEPLSEKRSATFGLRYYL